MPKLSPALNTLLLTQAHAHGWRKDRIKHRKFLLESLLKLANNKGELQLSAREIAQVADLSPRSVQSALKDLESIGMLQHFPPLKDPQFQLPNRYLLKHF
jgi:Fic family protein